LERLKLYQILVGILMLILIATVAYQVMARQPTPDAAKEKVKKMLIQQICVEKKMRGTALYECDNGFYGTESCGECYSCYYNKSGNQTKCCGGYRDDCITYQNIKVENCSKRDICPSQPS
jgi:hypothetical protein